MTAEDGSIAIYTIAVTVMAVPIKIAFSSNRDGNWEIYVMKDDGSDPVNLTRNPANDSTPSWSPDHNKIVFLSDRDAAGKLDIYVMNADGSAQRRLTTLSPGTLASPKWSPDGAKIAFANEGQLAVMNADGSNLTWLHPDEVFGGVYISAVAWSPDGSKMAIVMTAIGAGLWTSDLGTINADGSGLSNETNPEWLGASVMPWIVYGPLSWSPGDTILSVSDMTSTFVNFSPDPFRSDICAGGWPLTTTGDNSDAAGAPDGTRIVFSSTRDGNSEIYLYGTYMGQTTTRLTNNPAQDVQPAW